MLRRTGTSMQRPLQITYKGMESSPSFDAIIHDRVAHVERLYPRLIGCRVVIEVPHRGAETAKVPIAISVEADLPGRGPVVGKDEEGRHDAKGDHAAPLNRAFDAVERQLKKLATSGTRGMCGSTKTPAIPAWLCGSSRSRATGSSSSTIRLNSTHAQCRRRGLR
jgi:ribosome-associated translation inhibitor RaiA